MADNELSEVVYVRMTLALRGRIKRWRERLNKTAPNPLNEADALRVAIAAGMDRLESDK